MHLRPFFCYFGGKARAAAHYPWPSYDAIIEPFAGAAGYATRWHKRNVLLIDKDPIIAGLWTYLTKVKSREIMEIPILRHDQTVDDLGGVAEEAKHLVGFWLNKGTVSPRRAPSTWMRSNTRPKSYWCPTIRNRIALQVQAIRHWKVSCGSYEAAPDVRATWFIDPPYEGAGVHYRCGARDIDFESLAAWVRARKGLVLVCEEQGASWLPFKPFRLSKANPTAGQFSEEALYTRRSAP